MLMAAEGDATSDGVDERPKSYFLQNHFRERQRVVRQLRQKSAAFKCEERYCRKNQPEVIALPDEGLQVMEGGNLRSEKGIPQKPKFTPVLVGEEERAIGVVNAISKMNQTLSGHELTLFM